MKIKKIISGVMALCLAITFSSTVRAETNKFKNIKDLPEIRKYQEVIDKINLELGAKISIPDNKTIEETSLDRDVVYKNIVNQSLAEFEQNLRKDYQEFKDGTYKVIKTGEQEQAQRVEIPVDTGINNIQPFSIREPITQICYLYDNNTGASRGAVDLKSEVFSSSGSAGSFVYSTIYSLGYYVYTDRTHFRATSGTSYTLSSDKKNCFAKYTGSYYTATGLQLTSITIINVTYSAG